MKIKRSSDHGPSLRQLLQDRVFTRLMVELPQAAKTFDLQMICESEPARECAGSVTFQRLENRYRKQARSHI